MWKPDIKGGCSDGDVFCNTWNGARMGCHGSNRLRRAALLLFSTERICSAVCAHIVPDVDSTSTWTAARIVRPDITPSPLRFLLSDLKRHSVD